MTKEQQPKTKSTQHSQEPTQKPRPFNRSAALRQRSHQATPKRAAAETRNPPKSRFPQQVAIADSSEAAVLSDPIAMPPRWKWLLNWYWWGSVAVVGCAGASVIAAKALLGVPALPNCPAIFWPLAPASLRFECARLAASKRTAKNLLEAIALLDSLPKNHSLREEADRMIEEWATQVLDQTEETFNEGNLKEAIASARKIPPQTSAYKLVEERIKRWESVWAEAEKIRQQTIASLGKRQYRQAFEHAVRLLNIDNKYWQTTGYDNLIKSIDVARIDGNKLYEAERMADAGGSDNLLKALKIAQSIKRDSLVYDVAQRIIPTVGRKMLTQAQKLLNQRDLQGALSLLSNVPNVANLKAEAQDLSILANAQYQAWQGNVVDLEGAIAEAQQISGNRPLAKQAQQWIARWRQEIFAMQARDLAQSGNTNDLSAAINQASLVTASNPRREEVERQIKEWRSQIQTIEDRPILDQADQYASSGDVTALQAAIAQAQQIRRGRALYSEAQTRIQEWNWQIQATYNQPVLEQARQYANVGDLSTAIQVASQIPKGQAYYQEARTEIRNWRKTINDQTVLAQAQAALSEARQLANYGTSDGLASAIAAADRVSPSSSLRTEADQAIDQWSWQLLQIATDLATAADFGRAIAIAQQIPSGSAAYSQAQKQIKEWQSYSVSP